MRRCLPSPWLRWLLVAAFAGCLNPHPDDEPTVIGPPKQEPGSAGIEPATGSSDEPPILIVDTDDGNENTTPPQPAGSGSADAGVPTVDGGVASGDAGVP